MLADTATAKSQAMNFAPANLNPEKDLPKGFLDFLLPLHKRFTPWQQTLIAKRAKVLQASHRGEPPNYLAGLGGHYLRLANRNAGLVCRSAQSNDRPRR